MTRIFYRPTAASVASVASAATHYDPFRAFVREVFEGIADTQAHAQGQAATGATEVRVDVREAANEYTVIADLPGVSKEAINIEINGADVKIDAQTKPEDTVQRSYARSFTLPAEIDDEKAAAQFENGLLKLTLPKKSANAAKRLLVA